MVLEHFEQLDVNLEQLVDHVETHKTFWLLKMKNSRGKSSSVADYPSATGIGLVKHLEELEQMHWLCQYGACAQWKVNLLARLPIEKE